MDQRGTLCLLRGIEHFELDCFDTISGIYTCNAVKQINYGKSLVRG